MIMDQILYQFESFNQMSVLNNIDLVKPRRFLRIFQGISVDGQEIILIDG